ncbi:TIGR03085 family metal-binding protein [Cellulomonas sp. P22]|uniref:TIGR03085 family metal-binding protein n=1 Tax=Cellulomonas sp. P22 TaxID=3373189 RepID=UPI0037960E8A
MTSWHALERAELVQVLTEAGPDAPTLCSGWRSRHLAAHVVLRERSLVVPVGLGLPPLADRAEHAIDDLAEAASTPEGYSALLARVAEGPAGWHPLAWAGELTNVLEFFVHAEDVRRGDGDGEPRALDAARTDMLWRQLVRMAPLPYRGPGTGVVLVRPDGVRRAVRRPSAGRGTVVVRGDVGELVLHAFGRGEAAHVTLEGAPDDVRALQDMLPGG